MPNYEYECPEHGRFEVVQVPMSESELPKPCSKCGTMSKRIISPCFSRMANPLTVFDHKGKVLATNPDIGITPPEGQPYPIEE